MESGRKTQNGYRRKEETGKRGVKAKNTGEEKERTERLRPLGFGVFINFEPVTAVTQKNGLQAHFLMLLSIISHKTHVI